ncbi:hypothetical protein HX021_08375 [Sphingobacterium sp. N143]|uniref:hypothetical protein n=1 Tax=Sphingobacterium sp. N143 TaxID=2746727 RepID=UPI002576B58B|nr:hypothetical protein [Sphingobacterium sp. N143]MDM1294313.1 hypothetical protein [Sphingobacterium sp. N143]
MESTQAVRTAVFEAISNIAIESKVIPVFDGLVNPNVVIPVVRGASCYIVIQDQQENLGAIQNMCIERMEQNITIRIVTKFSTAGVTDRSISESIADFVKKAIRTGRNHNLSSQNINIQKVLAPIVQQTDEFANGQTALSKILIYSIIVNQ